MSSAPVNDVPRILLDLAGEAIAAGVPSVRLEVARSTDPDEPMRWVLLLDKMPGGHGPSRRFCAGQTPGRAEPFALVQDENDPDLLVEDFSQGPEEIRAWLRQPLVSDDEDDDDPSWEPVSDPLVRERLVAHLAEFELAALGGWSVRHRAFSPFGGLSLSAALDPSSVMLPVSTSWWARNPHWDVAGHPSHRSTGTPYWVEGTVTSLFANLPARFFITSQMAPEELVPEGTPLMMPVDSYEGRAILSSRAPWFVPVPGRDDARGSSALAADIALDAAIADAERARVLAAIHRGLR